MARFVYLCLLVHGLINSVEIRSMLPKIDLTRYWEVRVSFDKNHSYLFLSFHCL